MMVASERAVEFIESADSVRHAKRTGRVCVILHRFEQPLRSAAAGVHLRKAEEESLLARESVQSGRLRMPRNVSVVRSLQSASVCYRLAHDSVRIEVSAFHRVSCQSRLHALDTLCECSPIGVVPPRCTEVKYWLRGRWTSSAT